MAEEPTYEELKQKVKQLEEEVSESKTAKAAFRKMENKYSTLVEHSPDIIYLLDPDGIFTLAGGAVERLIGFTPDELIGKHFTFVVHPEDREKARWHFNERRTGERATRRFEVRLMTKKGANRTFETNNVTVDLTAIGMYDNPVSENNQTYLGTYGIARDITIRKRTEEQLLESRAMLQKVLDGISDPLIIVNKDLSVRMINDGAKEYFRVDGCRSIVGTLCFKGLREQEEICEGCRVWSTVQEGKALRHERKNFLNPDRTELVVIVPLQEEEEISGAIVRIGDITETKLMQRKVLQSEKLASLGFLISGIAHEINNPNNFITFNVPILKDYLQELIPIIDDYAKQQKDFRLFGVSYPEFREDLFKLLDNIEHGSRRISSTVANLREFTRRKDEAELKWVDIGRVIEKGLAISRAKIVRMVKSLEVNIPENLPRIYTDPEIIEQILINLLINAAQAADKENSWIKVSVVSGDGRRNYLIIEVSDNGLGMDESIMKMIFDPFYTTKPSGEGTGLGLSLCHTMIESLGGRIEVESESGQGSCFRIILSDLEIGAIEKI